VSSLSSCLAVGSNAYDGYGEGEQVPEQDQNRIDEQFLDHVSICQSCLVLGDRNMLAYPKIQLVMLAISLPALSFGETALFVHFRA
jgi:hypothetical protein